MTSSKSPLVKSDNAKALLWEYRENKSIEYLIVNTQTDSFILEGTVIMLLEQLPTKIMYRLQCNKQWQTKHIDIRQERAGKTSQLSLKVNDEQVWHKNNSKKSFATGLFDVDLEISPATNTLPIRRLGLNVGTSQKLNAVWVRFPSLRLELLQQKYTRLSNNCYKYETYSPRYEAQLEVDNDGLVTSYDNLWHRIT